MQLSDFIVASLQEIVAGIQKAQASDGGNLVAPQLSSGQWEKLGFTRVITTDNGIADVQAVEFDVAVTLTREAGGKFTLGVAALGLGADAGKTASTEQVSRVRFKIPLALPPD
jgi:hypothetical protein